MKREGVGEEKVGLVICLKLVKQGGVGTVGIPFYINWIESHSQGRETLSKR